MKPRITIGITCFREGEWLRECWESVLAQTDPRWEAVLVMDGGGSEETRRVFSELSHPRLRKEAMGRNCGPFPSHNRAVELTRTPYHMILDADDRLPEYAVSHVIGAFDEYPQTQCIWGNIQTFGDSSVVLDKSIQQPDFGKVTQQIPGCCSYTKKMWKAIGGYADELARGNGDWDFSISVLEKGFPVLHLPEVLYYYRRYQGSVSTSYTKTMHQTFQAMVRRHPDYFSVGTRRADFLAFGYTQSATGNYLAGDLATAACHARQAQHYGSRSDLRLVWYRLAPHLPNWFRRILASFIRGVLSLCRYFAMKVK